MPVAEYDLYISRENPRHEFQVRILYYNADRIYWQLSCGCSIRMQHEELEKQFQQQMYSAFDGHALDKKDSFWGENNLKKTEHYLCPKDSKLVERLGFIVEHEKETLFPIKELAPFLEFQWLNLMKNTFSTQVDIFENLPKKKPTKKLPEVVRKHLEEEIKNESNKRAMSDDQLVDLFNQPTKKQKKNKQMKKPNKGKAPNNIRKTKKPAKL